MARIEDDQIHLSIVQPSQIKMGIKHCPIWMDRDSLDALAKDTQGFMSEKELSEIESGSRGCNLEILANVCADLRKAQTIIRDLLDGCEGSIEKRIDKLENTVDEDLDEMEKRIEELEEK